MSYFLADSTGPLTEFASIGGYHDFRSWAQTQSAPIRRFVHFGFTEDLKLLVEALKKTHAPGELEVLKELLLGSAEDAQDILVVSDGMSSDEELRAAAEAKKTLVHKAAEAFERRWEVACHYAFAAGRSAIKHGALQNANTVEEADKAVALASLAMRAAFSDVLPSLSLKTLQAGGDAGIRILQGELRTAGGSGSGNFGHAGRPGERGGSSSAASALTKLDKLAAGRDRIPVKEFNIKWFKSEQREVDTERIRALIKSYPAWAETKALGYTVDRKLHVTDGNHRLIAAHLLGVEGPEIEMEEDDSDLRTAAPRKSVDVDDIYSMRFDIKNPLVEKWARKHTAKLLDDLTITTQHDIASAILYGHETGDLRGQYKAILAAVGDRDRAQLIARNETMMLASNGQRLAWKQAVQEGLLSKDAEREWITADLGACKICENLNGKTAKLDGEYPDEGGEGPPQHVQCLCTEGISAGR